MGCELVRGKYGEGSMEGQGPDGSLSSRPSSWLLFSLEGGEKKKKMGVCLSLVWFRRLFSHLIFGLDGLGWAELGWAELGWVGLGWDGMGWAGFGD